MADEEREFVERRFHIVEDSLGYPKKFDADGKDKRYDIDQNGTLHFRTEVSAIHEYALIREARILEKLMEEVEEGKIRRALAAWRKYLGEQFTIHSQCYREMQELHDSWLRLPWPTRIDAPEPPQPPECEVTDRHGQTWLVDGQLLCVFDDLLKRLDKWLFAPD